MVCDFMENGQWIGDQSSGDFPQLWVDVWVDSKHLFFEAMKSFSPEKKPLICSLVSPEDCEVDFRGFSLSKKGDLFGYGLGTGSGEFKTSGIYLR